MGKTRARIALGIPILLLAAMGAVRADEDGAAAKVDLPRVGTLGTAPSGPGTIVVTVTGDGAIYVGGRGPLDLVALRDALAALTANPEWREPDRSSKKHLLVNADASLPWCVSQWIMQVAAEPTVQLYKIAFGARPRSGEGTGAIGWKLPKDRGPAPPRAVEPQRVVTVKLFQNASDRSDPEALYPLLLEARKRFGTNTKATFEVKAPRPRGMAVPTGFVIQVVEVAARAGFASVWFEGTPAPLSVAGRPDSLKRGWLREKVAELKAQAGTPTVKFGDGLVPGKVPDGVEIPPARGLLPEPFGFPGVPGDPFRIEIEEELEGGDLEEVVEEEEEGGGGGVVAPEPVIRDGEVQDGEARDLGRERRRARAVEDALLWLQSHQAPNGGWEAKTFGRWCDGKPATQDMPDGPGREIYDVGVTGLALCAFLGQGYTHLGNHPYTQTVAKGLRYLKKVQDVEGCFGPRSTQQYPYNHAIASLAMVEAYGLTGSPLFKPVAQKALDFIAIMRNPYFVWRYGVKPGDNDTSVTAWMTTVLKTADLINRDAVKRGKPAPLTIDGAAFEGVKAWIRKMTDPDFGRTGYIQRGGSPARQRDTIARFPTSRSESMTAAGMLCRVLAGERSRSLVVRKGAKLLSRLPPTWNTADGSIDMYYWYYGTLAMYQVGGDLWRAWNDKMLEAVLGHQRQDTDYCHYKGSWDPVGAWGADGGRVYSTALLALTLEAKTRFPRLP